MNQLCLTWLMLLVPIAVGCGSKTPPVATAPLVAPAADPTELGGRLFDNFKAELDIKSDLPRLKDLFGWDLRGRAGLYGAPYANKATAVSRDWLAGTETKTQIVALLRDGEPAALPAAPAPAPGAAPPPAPAAVPAYGAVLSAPQLEAIADFIVAVRDGTLPRPDAIWTLTADSPGNYRLVPGANPAQGRELYAARCADCHGADGTEQLFDGGEYSLGSHARQKAYEDWLKILNGHPGSDMKRQVNGDGQAMAAQLRDLLAALCDRAAFPRGKGSKADVPDGDPRCGEYLK